MIVLVDMDDTIADFGGYFWKRWREEYGDDIPVNAFKTYDLGDSVPTNHYSAVHKLWQEKGFFLNLEPKPGAIEALKEMVSNGYDVVICSSPTQPHSMEEKGSWIEAKLGLNWTKHEQRFVLTKDKTLIQGDFLIDDKPNIKGRLKPSWTQIVADMPYNRDLRLPRLVDWSKWRDTMKEAIHYKLYGW